ncbi:MAG: nuclear transport factor 2 family protein [Bacteroidota bacterium]
MRLIILLLSTLLVQSISAQTLTDAEQVKQADEQLNDLIRQNNAQEAEKFYTEDFLLITSGGGAKLKQDILKEIGSTGLVLEINKTEDVKVRVHGTTAVLTGVLHQKGVYKGKAFDAFMQVTDTWIRTESGWKILAGHASLQPKS